MLLDVAAHFASEHGVPVRGVSATSGSIVAADRRAVAAAPRTAAGSVVGARGARASARRRRRPRPVSAAVGAATEDGAVGGWDLRQLVRQHRDKASARRFGSTPIRCRPPVRARLWHAVFRASRFLGRLHDHGLTDEQILALLDSTSRIRLRAGGLLSRAGPATASVSLVTDVRADGPEPADGRRVAIVTGGGSGIGAASAVALARDGWTVVVAGRRVEPLTALVAEHADLGMDCGVADVTDPTSVHNLFARDGEPVRTGRPAVQQRRSAAPGRPRSTSSTSRSGRRSSTST